MGNKKAAHLDLPLPTRPATLALPWNTTHLSLLHVLRPGGKSSRYQIQLGLAKTADLVRFPESGITAGERGGFFPGSSQLCLGLAVGRGADFHSLRGLAPVLDDASNEIGSLQAGLTELGLVKAAVDISGVQPERKITNSFRSVKSAVLGCLVEC